MESLQLDIEEIQQFLQNCKREKVKKLLLKNLQELENEKKNIENKEKENVNFFLKYFNKY